MHATSFKVYHFIFLALFGSTFAYSYDFGHLNNLGEEITRKVNQQVAPLQNLGREITRKVNEQLAPLQNLGARIRESVQRQLQPLRRANFYSRVNFQQPIIQPYPQFAGPDLSHLGERIQQSVYQGLEPVRALPLIFSMKNGRGGTTIATHLPEGKELIIKNSRPYECDGTISNDGKCTGTLNEFKINDKKDHCYNRQGFSIVNNYICIGASTVSVINENIECLTSSGQPALLIPVEEYKKLCQGISNSVEYKYIADPQDPAHVEIPNQNKYVRCSNNQPGVCIFTKQNPLLPTAERVIVQRPSVTLI